MPSHLRRYQQSGQSHFLTFSCYRRRPNFTDAAPYDLFVTCLEDMRRRFAMYIYGYVVMPEHVHLLVSEPERETLANAIHYLKLSFTKRLAGVASAGAPGSRPLWDANLGGSFWEKRYYDRNVRDAREFSVKLRYLHRNPVKRGLVSNPADWKWSSFRHYALREKGPVEIESEWTGRDRETAATGGPARVFLTQC
jgi:putative transposase